MVKLTMASKPRFFCVWPPGTYNSTMTGWSFDPYQGPETSTWDIESDRLELNFKAGKVFARRDKSPLQGSARRVYARGVPAERQNAIGKNNGGSRLREK